MSCPPVSESGIALGGVGESGFLRLYPMEPVAVVSVSGLQAPAIYPQWAMSENSLSSNDYRGQNRGSVPVSQLLPHVGLR